MPDYNLYGLSWRSFEQLIQALAAKFIGPRIVIFGDGSDGGREATYEGKIPYPAEQDPWEGYLVLQAKFRQRLAAPGAESDAEWALAALRGELNAFADPDKRRRAPQYYIFATNVVLSSVSGTGAKDKASALFAEFAERLPIKDFDIWDYDKIRTFLDDAEDIRRAYCAWITPGDVLAQVMEWFGATTPDFDQVMVNFLQKELAADQNVKLDQAGHTTDQPTPLAKVFVDLRVSHTAVGTPPEDEKEGTPLPAGIVARVLEMGAESLDPRTHSESAPPSERTSESPRPVPGRIVLVGGPGQGKTTVSQLIAQLHRAAILKERPAYEIDAQVRPVLGAIVSQCEREGMHLPRSRRFPVRVVLNEFADALARDDAQRATSLLSYLLERIKKRTDRNISPDDLRNWLGSYPWLILLDGLDEVPTSCNRDEVLAKIGEFWVDATQCNADVLVVATTRPQGYHDEFTEHYEHCYLTPLSTARAMHYGKRFASVRHGADEYTREVVVSRLQAACKTEATARLMRSPLQVTIMATLVAQLGEPPRERWGLFKKYYDILYQREVEKGTALSRTLLDHKTNVDAIHQRVGLHLQVDSERRGTAEPRLSSAEFRQVVVARLREEGYSGPDLETLATEIMDAAAERLVFLVGMESDRVGFEIRSLQEFMAAEALMNGGDQLVGARLRSIAAVPHWRNVFLFAAGKCFADRQDLRDTVYTICCELNEAVGQGVEKAVLAGSRLALELLEDGAPRRQPKYRRMLSRLALRLIELPPSRAHARIADQYDASDDSEIERMYRELLSRALCHSAQERRLGAWATLLSLIWLGVPWAEGLGNRSRAGEQ